MNLAAAVLTFREGLEAALILAIVLTYLRRTNRAGVAGQVWAGAGGAALLTVVFVVVLQAIGASFTYPAQGIFEGVTSLVAVAMVTSMTFWMARQGRQIKGALEREVQSAVAESAPEAASAPSLGLRATWQWGLFGVAFFAVGREGVETGLFLAAAAFASSGLQTLYGGLAGLLVAAVVAWSVYAAGLRLNLRAFFRVAGVLLVLFGAAMLRYAVQEFEEVGLISPIVERVWNTGAWLPDSSGAGAVLSALVGYTSHPSLAQVLAYLAYFAVVALALFRPARSHASTPLRDGAPGHREAEVSQGHQGRRLPWLTFSLLALVFALFASACSGGAATQNGAGGPLPAGGKEVMIAINDRAFNPNQVQLEAGQAVRITFVNEGKDVHQPEIKGLVPETKLVAGQKKSYDVTPKAGTYQLYDELHEDEIKGSVVVK